MNPDSSVREANSLMQLDDLNDPGIGFWIYKPDVICLIDFVFKG